MVQGDTEASTHSKRVMDKQGKCRRQPAVSQPGPAVLNNNWRLRNGNPRYLWQKLWILEAPILVFSDASPGPITVHTPRTRPIAPPP